ncbi:TolC family protein [Fundidesulfovibrio terrae]|uniref:TolC family protein n=1 Tax=Fundidesulfovibrio terrae TaxID=2922866 RepID=UPI001FAF59A0|nr:TolC family protein [Fundidesulfovibrio terrae]
MHRTAGPVRLPSGFKTLAVLACLALAWACPAMAQQTKGATVKSGEVKPLQSETLPTAPPAKATETAQPAPAKGQDMAPPMDSSKEMSTTVKEPADFNECVRVALVQSPMLVKSALEIETKRLDVQDAWGTFIPTISINTTYWFRMPTKTDGTTDKPYTISFSTSQWNPILAGFDVKAKNQMTNIAVLGHLKVIGEGLKRLASDFLQLSAMQEQKEVVKKKQELAKQNLEFFKTRLGMGQATQLDIRIAETRIQMTKAEDDKVNSMRAMVMDDIKFILGVPFTNKLDLDVAAAKKQILGKFSPADVTDEKVRAYSFDLRIQEYEKNLQKMNIGLSYVKLLPTFGFTFQTVDAFNNTSTSSNKSGFPFYPGINISMPLDYWTRGREIARQYKKMDQVYAGARAKEFELMVSVQKAMSDYQATTADFTLANSKMELNKLQDEQTEYRYKTGQVDFDKYVTDRNEFYEARQKMILEQTKRDVALLTLKHLTGDLQGQYVDVAAWEK